MWSDLLSAGATLVGAGSVTYQILQLKRQESKEYIASYNARYERIVAGIPLRAILGESTTQCDVDSAITRAFFDYFQLCEEQLSLREDEWKWIRSRSSARREQIPAPISNLYDRIRGRDIWRAAVIEWHNGMAANLGREAFSEHLRALHKTPGRDGEMQKRFIGFVEHFFPDGLT